MAKCYVLPGWFKTVRAFTQYLIEANKIQYENGVAVQKYLSDINQVHVEKSLISSSVGKYNNDK